MKHNNIKTSLQRVTPTQKNTFDTEGVVKLKGVLSLEQIQMLRYAADDQLRNSGTSATAYDFQDIATQIFSGVEQISVAGATRFDTEFYRQAVQGDQLARPLLDRPVNKVSEKGKFFYDAAGWLNYQGIRKVAMDSDLPEITADLLSSEYINFWEDTTFIKTPNTPQRTAFHQDKTYFQISGDKCCIVWIPLDPVDSVNGAMEYIRGSHLWGREFAPNVFFAQTAIPTSDAEKLPDIEANRDEYDIVKLNAEPGDVIIHHVLTVHGAGGNCSSDRNRRALSFRYCGDDIKYQNRPGTIPQSWLDKTPNEGSELYAKNYPRVFPRAYPGAATSALYA